MENPFDGPKPIPYPTIEEIKQEPRTSEAEAELTPEQEQGLIIAENFELQRADLMGLLPNAILTAIVEFRPKPFQNFLA